jgi:hypothetical protein
VAYYKGALPIASPTPAPSRRPAPSPTQWPHHKPTSTPGTPTHNPTRAPHSSNDDIIKRRGDDDDDAPASVATGSTGAVVAWVFGALALAGFCCGGGWWATTLAKRRGYGSAWAWATASVVDPYSPMGSASMERAPSGLTLDQLRQQHADAVSPVHGNLNRVKGGGGKGGGGKGGGYMPPVLAVPTDDDEEEEEVAIGGVGKYSASV